MESGEAPPQGGDESEALTLVKEWIANGGHMSSGLIADIATLANDEVLKELAIATVHAKNRDLATRRYYLLLRLMPGNAFDKT